MNLNPFDWTWGRKEGGVEKYSGTINGQPTRFEIDVFGRGLTRKTYFPESYRKYVELQKEVFVVNNAVGKIAKYFSKANFKSENDNDKIVMKLENPNEKQSKQEFLKEFATFIKSAGWTVIWKRWVSVGNFDSLELINLDPDCIEFTSLGIECEHEDKEYKLGLDDIIIFYDTVRQSDGKGYSVLRPLRSQIENILDAQKAKGIQIENSGTTIVSPKAAPNTNNVDEGLNGIVNPDIPGQQTQKQQIEEKLNGRGIENRIIVASKGLDATNLSTELNSVKFADIVESDILAVYDAYGVPVELTPYGKNATFDNKAVAELSLVQGEVEPLAENLINSLNSEFEKYGKAEVNFDTLDCMSVVKKREQETNGIMIEQVKSLLDSGLIDDNKAKEMLKDIIG